MQGNSRRIQGDTDENQPGRSAGQPDIVKGSGAGFPDIQHNPGQQEQPPDQVHQDIPKPRFTGRIGPGGQNQKCGTDRHNLPKQVQGEKISGKHHAQRGTGIHDR